MNYAAQMAPRTSMTMWSSPAYGASGSFAERTAAKLDRMARADVRGAGKSMPAFRLCGCAGLAIAFLLSASLATHGHLSPLIISAITIAGVAAFLAVVVITRLVTGEEKIIYYHHEIAVGMSAAVLLWLLGRPVLPYLDLTLLGVGAFLSFGRLGCFMVGCCHGRPHRWGVVYRKEHADAGFPQYLVGVRLFPVQLVESVWAACVVLIGIIFVIQVRPAGTALAWYVVAYGVGRFFFEFARGDSDRSYLFGFSQPQWISIFLMFAAVIGERLGFLPPSPWHLLAAGCLGAVMTAVAMKRRIQPISRYALLHSRHIREMAEIIDAVSESEDQLSPRCTWTVRPRSESAQKRVRIGCTSQGVQISSDCISAGAGPVRHYTLSRREGVMSEKEARLMADLILRLRHPSDRARIVRGNAAAVFHLMVQAVSGKKLVHS